MTTQRHGEHGLSLVEVSIVLMVLSVLSSTMAPAVGDYVSGARAIKVRSDCHTIATGIARFVFDVGSRPARQVPWREYDVLVGAGEVPLGDDPKAEPWRSALVTGSAGLLDAHLVTNEPGYAAPVTSVGINFGLGWSGPYLEAGVGSDPWGHRYAVNVRHLGRGDGFDTIVISAGANGIIETPFRTNGVQPHGDDIIALIGGD